MNHPGPAHCLALANLQCWFSLVPPRSRILSLEPLPSSCLSRHFELLSHNSISGSGSVDYASFSILASIYNPTAIFVRSLAPKPLNYLTLREISRQTDSYLVADISSIAGAVAAGLHPSPFNDLDVDTMSTQGSLCGPPGALIFTRRNLGVPRLDLRATQAFWKLDHALNDAVFPGHQGGPHAHAIAGIAVALGQASSSCFQTFQNTALTNASLLQKSLRRKRYKACGGDKHNLVIGIESEFAGSIKETLFRIGIETGPVVNETGLLLGSTVMTFNGFEAEDFRKVANILDYAIQETRACKNAGKTQVNQQSKGSMDKSLLNEKGRRLTSLLRQEVDNLMTNIKVD
ncbi:glycine hydroxymethyltransferase shm1 [Bachmanniomyces sp. S44760]|nr:glycine hydroxymethyltransferase shm1 [Bachmanniomyces sp. S44760]